MKIDRIKIITIISALLWITVMFYKPAMLGAHLTPVAMCMSLILLFFYQINGGKITIKKEHFLIFLCFVYYAYCLLLVFIRKNTFHFDYVKAFISISVLVFVSTNLFSSDIIRKKFVRIFIGALAIWSVSYIIRIPIMILTHDAYAIPVFQTVIPRYGYLFSIYFPVTPGLGRVTIGPFIFLRLTALFRECGIGQLFYIWALSECEYYYKKNRLLKVLLLAGLVFSISTMGYVNLIVFLGLRFFLNINKMDAKTTRNNIAIVLFLIIILLAFTQIPGIRLSDKAAVSYNARFGGYKEIFSLFIKNPIFGTDAFVEGSSSGLFQYIYQLGIVGLLLYYIMIFFAFRMASDKKRFLLANIAGILTLTVSQPIWDAPLMFMLWTIPYKKDEKPL